MRNAGYRHTDWKNRSQNLKIRDFFLNMSNGGNNGKLPPRRTAPPRQTQPLTSQQSYQNIQQHYHGQRPPQVINGRISSRPLQPQGTYAQIPQQQTYSAAYPTGPPVHSVHPNPAYQYYPRHPAPINFIPPNSNQQNSRPGNINQMNPAFQHQQRPRPANINPAFQNQCSFPPHQQRPYLAQQASFHQAQFLPQQPFPVQQYNGNYVPHIKQPLRKSATAFSYVKAEDFTPLAGLVNPQFDFPKSTAGSTVQNQSSGISNKGTIALDAGFGSNIINHIPIRRTTSQQSSIETLMNAGNQLVRYKYEEALEKWQQVLSIGEKSNDLILCAKMLSNIACIYKNMGKYHESLQNIRKAMSLTNQYISLASTKNSESLWLHIAIRQLDLKCGIPAQDVNAKQAEANLKEFSNGPPLLIWLFHLTNNIGNMQFCAGDYEYAIRSFKTCMALCEESLEHFPLPYELAEILQAAIPLLSVNHESSTSRKTVSGKGYKLSAFHSHAILTKARCLTHIGSCFLALGQSSTSLQYQLAAKKFITSMMEKVPSLCAVPQFGSRRSSISGFYKNGVGIVDWVLLEVAVRNNLARAWFETGSVGKSITAYEKSVELFQKLTGSITKANSVALSNLNLENRKSQGLKRSTSSQSLPNLSRNEPKEYSLKISEWKIDSLVDNGPSNIAGLEEIRQWNNLGTLYLHIATSIKNMQWSRELQRQDEDAWFLAEQKSWSSYYDEFNTAELNSSEENQDDVIFLASLQTIKKALKIFLNQGKRLSEMNDRFGTIFALLNIGNFDLL